MKQPIVSAHPRPSEEEQAEFAKLREELTDRCKAVGINVSKRTNFLDFEGLQIEMPAGKETRTLHVFGLQNAKQLLSFSFEKYALLPTLNGVVNREEQSVEVLLGARNLDLRMASKLLFGEEVKSDEGLDDNELELGALPSKSSENWS